MLKYLLPCLLITQLTFTSAEARSWKTARGKTFEADFVSHDGVRVTLRRGQRIISYEISKLHASEKKWLNTTHPLSPGADADSLNPPSGAAFDTLEFGDSKEEVIEKMRRSTIVDGDVVEALLARTGMNGIYRTKHAIGGLHCSLFFEWTRGGSLREVSLRTTPLDRSDYHRSLKENWSTWIEFLSKFHGKPKQNGEFPEIDDLDDGLMLGSHLWHTEDGHSVILGTGQDGSKFHVVVRITSEYIRPNRIQ